MPYNGKYRNGKFKNGKRFPQLDIISPDNTFFTFKTFFSMIDLDLRFSPKKIKIVVAWSSGQLTVLYFREK